MPAFQAASRYLATQDSGALETYGFLPAMTDGSETPEISQLKSIDQRKIWWHQYATLKGEDLEVPEAFSSHQLADITHEPLLCYLLALAGYATKHWQLAAENRNRIYAALIDSVYERGWGDGANKRLGPGRTLSRSDFTKLMETIALAAWLGGDTRIASEGKFDEAVSITGAKEAWEAFTQDNGDDVTNLAMNFYLKSSEKSLRGFEFTHKSFGEYLAGRALISVAIDVSGMAEKRPEVAMHDWATATRSGTFTSEMLAFLRDEIRLRLSGKDQSKELKDIAKIKIAFEKMVRMTLTDGFPIVSPGQVWRYLEVEQANSECCMWVVLDASVRALRDRDQVNFRYVDINWTTDEDLSKILCRLSEFKSTRIVYKCFSNLMADRQKIYDVRAYEIDFEGSSLIDAIFVACALIRAKFDGADLTNARFYESWIDEGLFIGANLNGLVVHSSKMHMCNFNGATAETIMMTPLSILGSYGIALGTARNGLKIMTTSRWPLKKFRDQIEKCLTIMQEFEEVINPNLVADFNEAVTPHNVPDL